MTCILTCIFVYFCDILCRFLMYLILSIKRRKPQFSLIFQQKSRFYKWQGQKDLNPRHAGLEISIHSLFIAVYRLLGGTLGAHIVFYKKNVLLKPLIPYTFFCIFYTYNLLCVHHKIKQNFCKSSPQIGLVHSTNLFFKFAQFTLTIENAQ